MKNILLTFTAICAFATAAFADGITARNLDSAGFDKLSESQKAALVAQVEKQVNEANVVPQTVDAKKFGEWVDLGEKIGKGLSGAAKETGVAVNDFAKTPVGMITTGIIVWKFVGNSVYHFLSAALFMAVGFPIMHFAWKSGHTTITYSKDGKVESKEVAEYGPDAFATYVAVNCVILVIGVIILFTGN